MIGISLKKSKGQPKVVYVDQQSDEVVEVKFGSVKKPTSIFNTGITILTDDSKKSINVRSFSTSKKASITAEIQIKGSAARHGKATPSPYIKKYNIPQMTVGEIAKHQEDTEYMTNLILVLWKDCGHSFSASQAEKD